VITFLFHPDPDTHIEPVHYGMGSYAMGLLLTGLALTLRPLAVPAEVKVPCLRLRLRRCRRLASAGMAARPRTRLGRIL
jgi:hypothetical protein